MPQSNKQTKRGAPPGQTRRNHSGLGPAGERATRSRARLHQLSFTGGLLHLESPLDEGIKAEVMFHVGGSTIRSKAAMLFPMWATQGCLQPFEFTDLGEEDRAKLKADLEKFLSSPRRALSSPRRTEPSEAGIARCCRRR